MKRYALALLLIVSFAAYLSGCSTAPDSEDRSSLNDDSTATLKRMYIEDDGLQPFLANAAGYVVFPAVGKGGLIVGGSYGRGEVFQKGTFIGYADISQATVGLQAGGQKFSEVISFETPEALNRFEAQQLAFSANASAVALKAGAAASAKYTDGVAVFVEPVAGLMVEASVGGQTFSYQPK